jgi:hypothetical protein
MANYMRDPEDWEDEFNDDPSQKVDYNDDPAFDHLRDEERNFIAEEREAGR